MNIDTTLPGTSAEIVQAEGNTPVGTAGIIAVVGRF
jgi:hypothetical protein